ncbi:DUF4267 domain-containing protein [Nonomuraea rhizosphaerae]|uniref:DUF4267 domain-containing protein n=1 Tax=Nonomuraea rhizosphaerae TaxID=2665663 RepID=UPI001C5F033F|nr:DUF4267 domain-containing protein [Nonomuraea rhizosphaerae]
MSWRRVTTAAAALTALAVIFFGLQFLISPGTAAASFGMDAPQGDATGYFVVKGVRDVACGTVGLILLGTGHRRALGWVLLADAIIPIGDAIAVLTHNGSPAAAYGMHLGAAAVVVVVACLLLREARRTETVRP